MRRVAALLYAKARRTRAVLIERRWWARRAGGVEPTWMRVVVEVWRQLKANDATHMAAGVAYYAILSLFPLSLVILAVFGFLFADSESARQTMTDFFQTYLPQSTGLLDQNLTAVRHFKGVLGVAGFLGTLWTGLAVMGAIMRSINRAFGIRDDRPFYRQKPLGLAVGIAVVLLFLLSTALTAGVEIALKVDVPFVDRAPAARWLELQIAGRVIPGLFSLATFLIVYRFLPNTRTRLRYVLPGALVATVLFEAGKVVFVFYLDRFANFRQVYGGVASVVIMLVWFYYSALIVIAGAEVSAVYTRIREGLPRGAPAVVDSRGRSGTDGDEEGP